jgi:uncharacterized DUF497 family protein
MYNAGMKFEWDENKNKINFDKHGISFETAQKAFADQKRVIRQDKKHSTKKEKRMFCFGKVGGKIVTVRYTKRNGNIRIYGAGYWRDGRDLYETENV